MKTIIIGGEKPAMFAGDTLFSCSYFNINKNEKDKYYWISFNLFDTSDKKYAVRLIVYEGTEEHERISNLITSEEDGINTLYKYLNILAVKHLKPETIVQTVEELIDYYYIEGRKNAQKNIRQALGIEPEVYISK